MDLPARLRNPENLTMNSPASSWIKDLKDRDATIRYRAAVMVGAADEDADEAVPDLVELMKDSDARVREAAAGALKHIGSRQRVRPASNPVFKGLKFLSLGVLYLIQFLIGLAVFVLLLLKLILSFK
jgi:hypothetical protein